MSNFLLFVLPTISGLFLWCVFFGGQLPRPYRFRPCQGRYWKDAFPNASKDDVRTFLSNFTEAFAFSEKEKLKFNPSDSILEVYRALYPRNWMADALEVETLAEDMETKYGLKIEAIWYENLNLGELFAATRLGAGT